METTMLKEICVCNIFTLEIDSGINVEILNFKVEICVGK
jgi:hypothetical protein